MPEKTTNYELTKPLGNEFYDIGVFNGNADLIDAALKEHADSIATKADDAELKTLETTVTDGLQSGLQNTHTQITTHDASTTAHPDIRTDQSRLADRVKQLEDMLASDVTMDPYEIGFETLDGLIVSGVWNKTAKRIEF